MLASGAASGDSGAWCSDWSRKGEELEECPVGYSALCGTACSNHLQHELMRYADNDMKTSSGIFNALHCSVACPE